MESTPFVDIFGLLEKYKQVAPKNLHELKDFESGCRARGFEELADWIQQWRLDMENRVRERNG